VPFEGGAAGYFGYGAGQAFESLPAESRRDPELPHLYWAFYDEILAYRRSSDTFWHVMAEVPSFVPDLERSVSPVEELLEEAAAIPSVEGSNLELDGEHVTSNTNRVTFETMVREAKSFIEAGDIYQVNLSRRIAVQGIRNPGAVYLRLRSENPAPYSGYIGARNFAVISSSPELFLRRRGSRITTRPIKGTRPRSPDPVEDRTNRQTLLNSEKDLSELHMIVDLERNDLGRVCEYGTVETERLHELETFEHVHHLVGTVSGNLRSSANVTDILEATFPGGSVTGAPKIRAMEIIDLLEPTRRQVYTGSMGWIGQNGDLELNVCIRTLEWKDQSLYFQVGGGIVADSDPAEEFLETRDKARGMMDAVLGPDRE
jgi:para-aminobenzoate synthetase component 1